MLGNRIAKNARHLARWAKREGVSCYRVYDCDIPELPLTIDRYATVDATPVPHASVALWESARSPTKEWVQAMCEAIASTLGLAMPNLHLKVRTRQAGTSQYERLGQSGQRLAVDEDGLTFLVNLEDYLDTGLFLDHRSLRRRVRAESAGKRVLNLFAYTGAFTVHAIAGGATATTTIDLSTTYLDWAKDNLAANGFEAGAQHRLVRADIMQWIAEDDHGEGWDIAVVDPPTFSNSKKMRDTLDIQRDHVRLLRGVIERMRPRGVVYFSTNARRFKPDDDAFVGLAKATEISAETVPVDFRDKKIHRAWRLELP